MTKKIISVITALLMLCSFCVVAMAKENENEVKLQFNSDGKFTVVHLTDLQDGYPMYVTTKQYVKEMLAEVDPDLVVLGGDNTVGEAETKAEAVKEICDLFVESETYFTLVFGNHDHQQNEDMDTQDTKMMLLALFQQYGGKYCLAYDAVPELFGVGTHNLPIYSSDGKKVAFNLFMFDSNTYYPETFSDDKYDAVHTDQIEWYKNVAGTLKAENNGETVHSLVFQHIVVQEVYDKLFIESPIALGAATENFETKQFTYLPTVAGIESGYMLEKPCPGYINYGELDAMVETGDVLGIFSGHDHTNDYTVTIDGIHITNTAGCTFNSYGDHINRGARVIILDEKDTTDYETYMLTVVEMAAKEDSKILEVAATDKEETITKLDVAIYSVLIKVAPVLMKILKTLFFFAK